jgi:hypothetical protein
MTCQVNSQKVNLQGTTPNLQLLFAPRQNQPFPDYSEWITIQEIEQLQQRVSYVSCYVTLPKGIGTM